MRARVAVLSPAGKEVVTLYERYSLRPDDRGCWEADARLIAAAPDLLSVAIKSHEPYEGLSEEDIRSVYGLEEAKLAIALRDAIARATGDRPEKGGAL